MVFANISAISSLTKMQQFYIMELLLPYRQIVDDNYSSIKSFPYLLDFLYSFGIHTSILDSHDVCSNLITFLTHKDYTPDHAESMRPIRHELTVRVKQYTDHIQMQDAQSLIDYRASLTDMWITEYSQRLFTLA